MPHLCGSMRPRRVFGAVRFKAKRSMPWSALFFSSSWLHPCSHGNSASYERCSWHGAQHIPLITYNRESEEPELPFLTVVALMQSLVQPAALVLLRCSPLLLSCLPSSSSPSYSCPSKGGKNRQILIIAL